MKILCIYFNPPWLECIPTDPATELHPHQVVVANCLRDAVMEIDKSFKTGPFDYILSDIAIPEWANAKRPCSAVPLVFMKEIDRGTASGLAFFSGTAQVEHFQSLWEGIQDPIDSNTIELRVRMNPVIFTNQCGDVLESRNWKKLLGMLEEAKSKL